MASILLTVTDRDGQLEPVELGVGAGGADNVEAMTTVDASVGSGLAGVDEGVDSDGGFPIAFGVIILVFLVIGVAAGVLRLPSRLHPSFSSPEP